MTKKVNFQNQCAWQRDRNPDGIRRCRGFAGREVEIPAVAGNLASPKAAGGCTAGALPAKRVLTEGLGGNHFNLSVYSVMNVTERCTAKLR